MIKIHPWIFRGVPQLTVFRYEMVRRFHRASRKFQFGPWGMCSMPVELEPWEIGQLLGGN